MTDDRVVELDGVTIRYGRNLVVDGVSLVVPRGEVLALLGRNGAGKSSLVRCLLGQQMPTAGAIRLFGEGVWEKRASLMERVGYVPEEPDAPPAMSVAGIVDFVAGLYSRWDRDAVRRRLDRFSVPMKTDFRKLSRGQKAQVQLALALGHSPDLILFDDPTLGLDAVARRSVFEEMVGELAERGCTVVVTTHDLAGVEGIASRVGILRGGKLALDERMETLKSRFRRLRWTRHEGDDEAEEAAGLVRVRRAVSGWGVESVVSNWDELAMEKFAKARGVRDAVAEPMSLEEIFVAVAGEETERQEVSR